MQVSRRWVFHGEGRVWMTHDEKSGVDRVVGTEFVGEVNSSGDK